MATEDEAKAKWCPMARFVSGEIRPDGSSQHNGAQSSYNRVVDGDKSVFPVGGGCIGSTCMMWRDSAPAGASVAHARQMAAEGLNLHAIKELRAALGLTLAEAKMIVDGEAMWPDQQPTEGFCGLAGRPS